MDAPRALVFRPLVKGNEALGTRLSHMSLVNVVLLFKNSTMLCRNIMSFHVVSSLQQVIKLDVYFYSKLERFSLSYSLIDISRKQ